MPKTKLTELPHELWDHIVAQISTARDLSHLGQTNKALHGYIEDEGWATFTRSQFPWSSSTLSSSWKSTARSLSTVSRAWDRRAYVVRKLEPKGPIFTYPGAVEVQQWKRPVGQTMGFAPHIDASQHEKNATEATEVLAFSAGAQICLHKRRRKLVAGEKTTEYSSWSTYRPLSAREGIDDVTSINLLTRTANASADSQQEIIVGTANGDLHHLSMPFETGDCVVKTYFATQGLPVQAASLIQDSDGKPFMSVALGKTQLALYTVDDRQPKITPDSTLNFNSAVGCNQAFNARGCRIWTTTLLSREQLAVGLGVSETPLQLCTIRPGGLCPADVRSFRLRNIDGTPIKASSVFAVVPSHDNKYTFLSGSYDGVVRLHDLRAPENVQTCYSMPSSDNAIYSLLTRGQQTLLAGTSRHDLIHVFDMRMTSGRYCYLDAQPKPMQQSNEPYSLFMPRSDPRRREGSVYSLTSSSADSPIVYAGLQNTILEVAVTEIDHPHPDPLFFKPWPDHKQDALPYDWNGWKAHSIKNVARYENGTLSTQTDMVTTWHNTHRDGQSRRQDSLDIRWWQE